MSIRGLEKSSAWDYENGFYWYSCPSRLNKLLAHYELYKSIVTVPGDVFELGVYKAASLVRLATFRASMENDHSRKIVGFDAFGKFPTDGVEMAKDLDFIESFEAEGGEGLSVDEIESILTAKGFANVHLKKGNVMDTLPAYLEEKPHTKIAFLHLDMDVKESTAYALDQLFDRIVPGGLIVLDDYNAVQGATDAVDEFIAKQGVVLQKLPFYSVPAFIRK